MVVFSESESDLQMAICSKQKYFKILKVSEQQTNIMDILDGNVLYRRNIS